jgi:hypothetical protein
MCCEITVLNVRSRNIVRLPVRTTLLNMLIHSLQYVIWRRQIWHKYDIKVTVSRTDKVLLSGGKEVFPKKEGRKWNRHSQITYFLRLLICWTHRTIIQIRYGSKPSNSQLGQPQNGLPLASHCHYHIQVCGRNEWATSSQNVKYARSV